jgi:signal transduction histidine kinase
MLQKSLRTNIALNLAILLLISMLLIDLIMLIISQKMFIGARLEKGRVLMATLAANLEPIPANTGEGWRMTNIEPISSTIASAKGLCALVVSIDGRRIYRGGVGCTSQASMVAMAHQAALEEREITRATDMLQGIFGQQPNVMRLAAPLQVDRKIVAGGCLLMPLDDIYNRLKRTQHILLIYVLINTTLLTILGVYRLNRLTVKPIQRLVRRAEDYRDSDDNVFLLEKEDNEFSRLSKSLNRMMMHLAQDKEKLQATVDSLEMANRDLEKAQRELIRAEKLASVGRLSAGIAHEIGNPIGIIKGYLSLMNDASVSDEDKTDFIARTEKEVERINSIIQQLLDFSRPSGEDQEAVSVHEILRELEEVCLFQPVLACVRFELKLEADRDRVIANARQLRQVFLNLVLNAADAVRDADVKGELIIHTKCSCHPDAGQINRDFLVVRFMDNGHGIPDDNLTSIFDPFFTTKDPGKGTGLGLSVSFTIVEGLGGAIEADQNESGGTSMIIRLPLAPDSMS